jgi:hypothetical protein
MCILLDVRAVGDLFHRGRVNDGSSVRNAIQQNAINDKIVVSSSFLSSDILGFRPWWSCACLGGLVELRDSICIYKPIYHRKDVNVIFRRDTMSGKEKTSYREALIILKTPSARSPKDSPQNNVIIPERKSLMACVNRKK